MFKCVFAAAMLAAAGVCAAQDAPRALGLSATGDGEARLSVDGNFLSTLRVSASFEVNLPVKDSTEAQSKSRWFAGEIRIDGKPCSDAKGRIVAMNGVAHGEASTSCSVDMNNANKHIVKVEANVTKTQGVEAEDVRVTVQAERP